MKSIVFLSLIIASVYCQQNGVYTLTTSTNFNDNTPTGQILSGATFTYDSNNQAGLYSGVNIQTTAGPVFTGAVFDRSSSSVGVCPAGYESGGYAFGSTVTVAYTLCFAATFTGTGATINFLECSDSSCTNQRTATGAVFTVMSVTTYAMTSGAITSGAITSGAITSGAITSAVITSAVLTTSVLTTSALTTSAMTSGAGLTTSVLTTSAMTSGAGLTTSVLTSADVTTSAMTSGAGLTTSVMTSGASLTTSAMTSGAGLTTSAMTSGAGITSNRLTSNAGVTSSRATTGASSTTGSGSVVVIPIGGVTVVAGTATGNFTSTPKCSVGQTITTCSPQFTAIPAISSQGRESLELNFTFTPRNITISAVTFIIEYAGVAPASNVGYFAIFVTYLKQTVYSARLFNGTTNNTYISQSFTVNLPTATPVTSANNFTVSIQFVSTNSTAVATTADAGVLYIDSASVDFTQVVVATSGRVATTRGTSADNGSFASKTAIGAALIATILALVL